ncbi:MAG TPA: MBL fold metallo-hydrolase [Acidimicrobiia bacterium]|nr:MBL fold metallo-hydrolase [Acidimicrobiia bacterium]
MVDVVAFLDEGLGHSSYVVDLGDGRALAVDPPRFPEAHIAEADARNLRIAFTADTHSHADYISGSPALAQRGATFLASKGARLEVPHQDVSAGDDVELRPGIVMGAIATPGHTPDHLAYVLYEDGRPIALFSGGSLMVGTVGRTDLLGDERRVELAHRLYRALHEEILTLPDDLAVYPTHGAGSFCSAPCTGERTTTIGRERATNPLLQASDEDAFVRQLLEGFGSFPTYFRRLPEVNRRGPRMYEHVPALSSLDVARAQRLQAEGAVVIDVRPIEHFATGHVCNALSIELRPVFGSWLGWLVDPDRPLVFVLDDDQDRKELVRQCLDVGYENLAGELDNGMTAWRAAGLPESRIEVVDAQQMQSLVVDVRQASEYADGHVPGAVNVELGDLSTAAVPDAPVTVMCGHGERAMTGASILAARGRTNTSVLNGGPSDWSNATGRALE